MTERKKPHKGVYVLPNLFTAGSLFAAFLCVTYCFKGQFQAAALSIFLSAVLDGLDGKVARLTNTASQFGIEFDSLADMVAFGLAPGVLAWTWQLEAYGKLGTAVSFLFVACAALRLARFNVDVAVVSKRFFIGLPSPAAGCTLAAFVVFVPYLPESFLPYLPQFTLFLCILAPLLMVSRVRSFSFKEYGFVKEHPFSVLVAAMLILILLFSEPFFFMFAVIFVYIICGIVYTYGYMPNRKHSLLRRLQKSGDGTCE